MTDASTTQRIIIDRIVIDRAPGQNRAMLLHGDTVVELLADYGHAPNRIGSIHRVRIDRVIADQNRAYASLDDGTSVSVRLGKSDQAEAGATRVVTIVAGPRESKGWQAVMGPRIISANLVLLPGQQGISRSRAMAADDKDVVETDAMLKGILADAQYDSPGDAPLALILRRGAADQTMAALGDECRVLVNDWLKAAPGIDPDAVGMIYDGGGIVAQARRIAPRAAIIDLVAMDVADASHDDFDMQFDAALNAARQPSVPLAGGGVMWVTPTRALTAIDLDSGTGSLAALFAAAPAAIAHRLRLAQIGGLVAVDVPRAQPKRMRAFTEALAAAFANQPRTPEILGRTRGGVLECRLAYGHPFPTDLAGPHAISVLAVLRQIARRPMLTAPTIAVSPDMAEWLGGTGAAALQALDRPVARVVSSDVTLASLIETGHD